MPRSHTSPVFLLVDDCYCWVLRKRLQNAQKGTQVQSAELVPRKWEMYDIDVGQSYREMQGVHRIQLYIFITTLELQQDSADHTWGMAKVQGEEEGSGGLFVFGH